MYTQARRPRSLKWNYNTTIGRSSLQWAEHFSAYTTYISMLFAANSPPLHSFFFSSPYTQLTSLFSLFFPVFLARSWVKHIYNTLGKLCLKTVIFLFLFKEMYMLKMYNLFVAWKLTGRSIIWKEWQTQVRACIFSCTFFCLLNSSSPQLYTIFLINSFGNYVCNFCNTQKRSETHSLDTGEVLWALDSESWRYSDDSGGRHRWKVWLRLWKTCFDLCWVHILRTRDEMILIWWKNKCFN